MPVWCRSCWMRGANAALRDAAGRTAVDVADDHDNPDCVRIMQEWHRAYTLYKARSIREASLIVANSSAPVDAAPAYLADRATSGLAMPTVHVSPHQQHGQPSDDVGEDEDVEVDPPGGVLQYVVGLMSSIASLWGYCAKEGDTETGEDGYTEVDPVAVGGVVVVYAIEELNGEVFVELVELMGITGSDP